MDHRGKMKEREKINKNLNLARELKKMSNMKLAHLEWKEIGRREDQRKTWDHPDHSTVKIS